MADWADWQAWEEVNAIAPAAPLPPPSGERQREPLPENHVCLECHKGVAFAPRSICMGCAVRERLRLTRPR